MQKYLDYITKKTKQRNIDNISRTKAYQSFFTRFPEIRWALVASLISRNAGWNMTDLFLPPFQRLLSKEKRMRLFMTYERANWLIFSDAYPQLMVYQLSKKFDKPLFPLLKKLNVSQFMINEWQYFWKHRDIQRLVTSLIINEQHVIHRPVIKQSYFKYQVFSRLPYLLQDFLLMNAVILPTRSRTIYGILVHDFTNVSNRITIGKQVASVIFHPSMYKDILDFALTIEHTGSRRDYEQFLNVDFPKAPFLRTVYPIITHQDIIRNDWYKLGGIKDKWLDEIKFNEMNPDVGSSFYKKRHLLFAYYHLKNMISTK